MSLTRKEWEDMWVRVTIMEETVQKLPRSSQVRLNIEYEIKKIKEMIQSVVGQME